MSLGNNLLDLRKKKGLSQEEVAEILNVSRQTVSKWETDGSQPDFDKLKPLCELYNISADELLFGKNNVSNEEKVSENDIDMLKGKKAKYIGGGIFLYFLSIIWIMIGIPVVKMDPIVVSSVFLLVCGIATSLIVYASIVFKKSHVSYPVRVYRGNPLLRSIYAIITLVFTVIYLMVSFNVGAWNITWIIWIVYVICLEVVKLIYMLVRGGNSEE